MSGDPFFDTFLTLFGASCRGAFRTSFLSILGSILGPLFQRKPIKPVLANEREARFILEKVQSTALQEPCGESERERERGGEKGKTLSKTKRRQRELSELKC